MLELIRAHTWPGSHEPRVTMNSFAIESGVHEFQSDELFTHVPFALHVWFEAQPGPHVPPQPSEPHCLPEHDAWHLHVPSF